MNLKFTTYSNMALVSNKRQNFKDALDVAGKALSLDLSKVGDAEKAKVYFRRATAYIGIKDDENAIKDLEEADGLKKDGAVTRELEAARKRVKDREAKFKGAFKKAFK